MEVTAGLAIAGLLMITVMGLMMFGSRTVTAQMRTVDDNAVGDAISSLVKKQIEYADRVQINKEFGGHVILFSKEGRLYADGEAVYGEEFYKNRIAGCRIEPNLENTNVLCIEIYLKDQTGNDRYRNRMYIKLLNLDTSGIGYPRDSGNMDSVEQDISLYYRAEQETEDEDIE